MDNSEEKTFEERVEERVQNLLDPNTPMRTFHLRRMVAAYFRVMEDQGALPKVKNPGYVKEYHKVPGGYVVEYEPERATFKEAPFTWHTLSVSGAWTNMSGSHYFGTFIEAYADLVDYQEDLHGFSDVVRVAYAGVKALRGK